MKSSVATYLLLFTSASITWAQGHSTEETTQQVVRVTGVRFAYPIVQYWIDEFNKVYPDVQVVIESRGSSDPSRYDILVEAFEHPESIRKNREYVYIARYAVLPVANSTSEFSRIYSHKGLNRDLITQLFFHDIYADKEKQENVKAPYTIYTRLQAAGAPTVFSRHFGYEQKDIKGKAIAGADEHLVKALLRDSTGVSYLPLPVIYDRQTNAPVPGITVLPVDLNGNGRISDDEKGYDDLANVIARLEEQATETVENIPIEYIHLSVDRKGASREAVLFLQWVINHGEGDLHAFGYLKPDAKKLEKEKFEQFASRKIK
ncbi:MAG TPA: hypothetical protein VF191_14725 [Cyclobacteriaceae bacterium]